MSYEDVLSIHPIIWALCVVFAAVGYYTLTDPAYPLSYRITVFAATHMLIALALLFETWRLDGEKAIE